MKKLYLKRCEKTNVLTNDKHAYELKETDCGRYFIWKSKYPRDHKKVDRWSNGLSHKDFDTNEEFHKAYDAFGKEIEANKAMGTCFELAKYNYEWYLGREKDSEEYLEGNKQYIKPNGKNPRGVQIYTGTPESNAKKHYNRKDNKEPYGWGSIFNGYGNYWYLVDMWKHSDKFFDDKGKEIFYDREFYDSIQHNNSAAKRALVELKKLVEEKEKTGDMELYERYQDCQNSLTIKEFTAELRLQYYFREKTAEMKKEIKKILPRDKSVLKDKIFHEIKFDSRSEEIRYSAYSTIN